MTQFEYKVVPAPARAEKAKGVKGTPARFAHALERVMNEMAAEGWSYVRAETLPVEERQGLTGKTSTFQNLLVFHRPVEAATKTTPEPDTAAPLPPEPPVEPRRPAARAVERPSENLEREGVETPYNLGAERRVDRPVPSDTGEGE